MTFAVEAHPALGLYRKFGFTPVFEVQYWRHPVKRISLVAACDKRSRGVRQNFMISNKNRKNY